jgi:cytochrome P450
MLMWGAANRDPAKFPNPNGLSLERRQHHVTFGHGIHLCIGSTLARMEARVVLTAMLERDRFPALSKRHEPEWEYSLMVRRHRLLPMCWQ